MKHANRLVSILLLLVGLLAACGNENKADGPADGSAAMRAGFEVNGYVIEPGADLSGADLTGADLSRASLRGANLSGARLTGASLLQADLREVDLSGADLFAANFAGANLEGAILRSAVFNEETLWPPEYDPLGAGALMAN